MATAAPPWRKVLQFLQLDALREGVTIEGIHYAGIEARLEREQGSNVWIMIGLREGKNRPIKRVLEHLGLSVDRLIRVSFGPVRIDDLPEGAVAELNTRILRDQLGLKLAKQAAQFRRLADRITRPALAGRLARGGGPAAARSRRTPTTRGPRPRGPHRSRAAELATRGQRPETVAPRKREHVSALRAEARAGAEGRAGASSAPPPATARAARSRSSTDRDRAPAGSGARARPETAKRRRQARRQPARPERRSCFERCTGPTRIGKARTGRRPRREPPS